MYRKYVLLFVLFVQILSLLGCQKSESQDYINHTEEKTNLGDNELLKKISKDMIEEKSFNISLNDWGEVTFISCMPDFDESIDPLTDVSFYLINNEKVLYRFPDVANNNIRESGLCESVAFVLVEDVNHDAKEDFIIGVKYVSGAGPQGMVPYTEIRIYENNNNEFFYNKSISEEINSNLPQDVSAKYVQNLLFD